MRSFADHRRPSEMRDLAGFTLIELLVVIVILLILATLAISAYRGVTSADRVSAAARNFKTSLEGARSRAIADGQPRGIRLMLDPNMPHVVTSVVPIGASDYYEGVFDEVTNNDGTGTLYTANEWDCIDATGVIDRMDQRGLIPIGNRIELPAYSGNWYPLIDVASPNIQIRGETFLTDEYPDDAMVPASIGVNSFGVSFRLQLAPPILPGAEPTVFPRGVAIDLCGSRLPQTWHATSSAPGSYSPTMDIMFAANGSLTGTLTSAGLIHVYFADVEDIERSAEGREGVWGYLPPLDTDNPRFLVPAVPQSSDQVVSLFTQTGMSVVGDVDHTDIWDNSDVTPPPTSGADGFADTDTVFQYATAGREAK